MSFKKLLLITSEFPPQPGGIGNHALHLAQSFNENDFQVHVLTDQRSGEGKEEQEFDTEQDFEILRIERKSPMIFSYFNRIIKSFQLAKKNDTILLSGKFSLWVGGILSLFLNKKYVAIIHGSEVLLPSKSQRKFTDFCLERFDKVIAVSNYTKSLVKHLSLKVEVIPNGFEVDAFSEISKSRVAEDKLKLVTVGNVTQRKGQHNIINALPSILKKYPNTEYHMVGIPTTQDTLQLLARNKKVHDHVFFHGKVSEEKKMKILAESTIFMMLSEHTESGDVEGFGIAILEANAMGLPGIGAKGCGIEDAISNHKSGILVNVKDEFEIISAIDAILTDYTNFSERAINWSKRFTWKKIIAIYLKAIV